MSTNDTLRNVSDRLKQMSAELLEEIGRAGVEGRRAEVFPEMVGIISVLLGKQNESWQCIEPPDAVAMQAAREALEGILSYVKTGVRP